MDTFVSPIGVVPLKSHHKYSLFVRLMRNPLPSKTFPHSSNLIKITVWLKFKIFRLLIIRKLQLSMFYNWIKSPLFPLLSTFLIF